MKSRKLEVLDARIRIVPAILTVHTSLAEPPAGHTTVVVSSRAGHRHQRGHDAGRL